MAGLERPQKLRYFADRNIFCAGRVEAAPGGIHGFAPTSQTDLM